MVVGTQGKAGAVLLRQGVADGNLASCAVHLLVRARGAQADSRRKLQRSIRSQSRCAAGNRHLDLRRRGARGQIEVVFQAAAIAVVADINSRINRGEAYARVGSGGKRLGALEVVDPLRQWA